MGNGVAGFAQIAFCDAGTINSTKTNLVALGITRNEELKTSRYKPIKIDRDEHELSNFENLALVAETLQPSLYMLKKFIDWKGGNCDAQIIALDGTCFTFLAASNPLGVEPKLIYTDEFRLLEVTVEAAFPRAVWDALLSTALTATPVSLGLTPASGSDRDARRIPHPIFMQSPAGVEIYDNYIKRSLTIEPKRKAKAEVKNSQNISLWDRMIATAVFQMEDVSYQDYYNQRGKGESPDLLWKEANETENGAPTNFDLIQFAAGSLVQNADYDHSGTKSEMTVTYKGAVVNSKIDLQVGTGKGNAVADTKGITGGTMKFGY